MGLKLRDVTINNGGSVPIYSHIFFVMHLKQHSWLSDI